ncbi:MAG: ParB/RepB/Spo0J family partition protein [Lachnospiraceae bacterium]|nr:ParB/RepB/Spo0J family partition protein [Lachnospiraceae bacterium]
MAGKKGLGKGLELLIPAGTLDDDKKKDDNLTPDRFVKITKIEPNPNQPRKYFNEDALAELADSIKQRGIIEPLIVQDRGDSYEIVAGERRWRAAQIAGLKEVPVIIRNYTEQEIMEISLIENIQREDLNAIEEAQAYKRLLDEYHLTQDEVAERVSKSRTAVTNSIRLLKLNEKVQEMLINEMLSAGHARALLAIEDKDEQVQAAQKIFDEKMTVRDIEKYVKNLNKPKKDKNKKNKLEFLYQDLEEKMKTSMGTKVVINAKNEDKGKIEIEYYSRDDLDRITELLINI